MFCRTVDGLPLFAFYNRWELPKLSSMTGSPQVWKAIKKHWKKLKIKAFRVGSGEKKEVLIQFRTSEIEPLSISESF